MSKIKWLTLTVALVLMLGLMAGVTGADQEPVIVYGVESAADINVANGSGDLYEIDVANQIETRIFEGAGNYLYPYPNGLAFDSENERLYFAVNATDLYFWEFGADDIVFAGALDYDPITHVCGAAFGGGYYWYIPDNSNILYKVSFNAEGLIVDQEVAATIGGSFAYGDIVIDYEDGMLYGSGIVSYFTYDINGDVYWEAPGVDGSFLQIAWGSDGVLYGHHGQRIQVGSNHREWVSIEPATGVTTYLFTGENLYVDLASGQRLVQVEVCETAWAYGDGIASPNNEVEYEGVANPSNAWGWTNLIDLEGYEDPVELDLYVGAAQNDLEKGTWVGTVTVVLEGNYLIVTYELDEEFVDCWFSEMHLWVGETELPLREVGRDKTLTPTAAPGQFTYSDMDDHPFVVDVSELDEVWVAAHAVVCCYE